MNQAPLLSTVYFVLSTKLNFNEYKKTITKLILSHRGNFTVKKIILQHSEETPSIIMSDKESDQIIVYFIKSQEESIESKIEENFAEISGWKTTTLGDMRLFLEKYDIYELKNMKKPDLFDLKGTKFAFSVTEKEISEFHLELLTRLIEACKGQVYSHLGTDRYELVDFILTLKLPVGLRFYKEDDHYITSRVIKNMDGRKKDHIVVKHEENRSNHQDLNDFVDSLILCIPKGRSVEMLDSDAMEIEKTKNERKLFASTSVGSIDFPEISNAYPNPTQVYAKCHGIFNFTYANPLIGFTQMKIGLGLTANPYCPMLNNLVSKRTIFDDLMDFVINGNVDIFNLVVGKKTSPHLDEMKSLLTYFMQSFQDTQTTDDFKCYRPTNQKMTNLLICILRFGNSFIPNANEKLTFDEVGILIKIAEVTALILRTYSANPEDHNEVVCLSKQVIIFIVEKCGFDLVFEKIGLLYTFDVLGYIYGEELGYSTPLYDASKIEIPGYKKVSWTLPQLGTIWKKIHESVFDQNTNVYDQVTSCAELMLKLLGKSRLEGALKMYGVWIAGISVLGLIALERVHDPTKGVDFENGFWLNLFKIMYDTKNEQANLDYVFIKDCIKVKNRNCLNKRELEEEEEDFFAKKPKRE